LESVPIPPTGEEDGLLELEVCGVCGSDVDLFFGRVAWARFPLAVGHEPVGRILQVGATAARRWGVETGRRVAVLARLQCGRCRACIDGLDCTGIAARAGERPAYGFRGAEVEPRLWGGFATHMYLAPETRLVPLPDSLSTAAASLFNPLANGIEWTQEVGKVRPGERVVVLGPGPRGLACLVAALEAGARRVVVVGIPGSDRRLEVARGLGARTVLTTEHEPAAAILDELGGPPDLVLDTTPLATEPLELALSVVRKRGRVVVAGFKAGGRASLDVDRLINLQVQLLGAYSKSLAATERAVEMLAADGERLAASIATDAYSLDRLEAAVRAAGGGVPGASPVHVRVESRFDG
jgi:alcohol dehydrogenase